MTHKPMTLRKVALVHVVHCMLSAVVGVLELFERLCKVNLTVHWINLGIVGTA